MRTTPQRGITLLELLIAVTLVSALSLGILYSMRVGLVALEKTNQRFLGNRRVLGVERALEQQLAGLIPVGAECASPSGGPGGGRVRFFEGSPQSMRLITSFSLQEASRGYPRIVEYTVIPGADNVGFRLIVNETPYSGPFSILGHCVGVAADPALGTQYPVFRPVQARADSFILADKLAAVRFVYLQAMPPPLLQQWTPAYHKSEWPLGIRVEMTPLDPNPGNLDVTTVTVPVRVTADPFKKYAD